MKNIGVTFLIDGKVELQTIHSDEDLFGREALYKLIEDFINLIRERVHGFTIIFMEDYAYGAGHINVLEMESVGIMLYLLDKLKNNIELYLVPPTTVKKLVSGSGKASKSDMKKALLLKYPDVGDSDNHAIDSLGLIECYLKYSSGGVPAETLRSIRGRKIYLGGKE